MNALKQLTGAPLRLPGSPVATPTAQASNAKQEARVPTANVVSGGVAEESVAVEHKPASGTKKR